MAVISVEQTRASVRQNATVEQIWRLRRPGRTSVRQVRRFEVA